VYRFRGLVPNMDAMRLESIALYSTAPTPDELRGCVWVESGFMCTTLNGEQILCSRIAAGLTGRVRDLPWALAQGKTCYGFFLRDFSLSKY
jgi:hypothetical protein